MAASTYLLEGKTVAPDKALAAGIIDQVDDDPIKAARQWVLNASEGDLIKPWDQKGYKNSWWNTIYSKWFYDFCWGVSND